MLTPEQKQKQLPVEQRRRRPGHKAAGVREKMREVAEEGEAVVWWRAFAAEYRSWMTSAVVHMLLLIAFALWLVGKEKQYMMVVVSPPDEELEDRGSGRRADRRAGDPAHGQRHRRPRRAREACSR